MKIPWMPDVFYKLYSPVGFMGRSSFSTNFRRVRNVRELEDGMHCVLAGYCAAHPDSLYVMASQDKTGTGKKNRAARNFPWIKTGEYIYMTAERLFLHCR